MGILWKMETQVRGTDRAEKRLKEDVQKDSKGQRIYTGTYCAMQAHSVITLFDAKTQAL